MNTSNSIQAKRTSLLRRQSNMSTTEFSVHWDGPHADITKLIPGVMQCTQNRIVADIWSTADVGTYRCDGIVELEFIDAKSRIDAGSSNAISHMLPQDEFNFLDANTLCLVDGGAPQIRHGWIKVMLAGCFHQGNDVRDLELLISSSNVEHFSVEKVFEVFCRPALAVESEPPHVFSSIWFAEDAHLNSFFRSGSCWDQQARVIFKSCTAWRVVPLAIIPCVQ